MKKISILMAMALAMFAVTFTFTSCDDDDDIADTLWGVWEGDMYVESEWDGYTYQASSSVLAFDKDPYEYASGTGYWIDYYSNAPWDYYASNISWTVRNGEIVIYSIEEGQYYYISQYSLSNNYFTGYISDGYNSALYFELVKTSAPYWNGDSGYHYSSWYVNKKSRSADESSDSTPVRRIRKAATDSIAK
ncbi:MAG: hepatitis A virus cellular receptor 1 [Prevotellaceae bacterium]|nr:hepatitis A virus cellular receptor 1 [Prevotellaceae bacterium]